MKRTAKSCSAWAGGRPLRERRAPARRGGRIADEEPPAKLGLGVPGNLIRSRTLRFADANGERKNCRCRHLRERRAPARRGEGIADEERLAKLGLGVPGNLIRSLTPSLRGATARSRLLIPGNAEPQLGKGRESRMKSDSPSWGLAFPGTSSAHEPFASRGDSKVAAPHPRERRAPARQGEGIADEEPLAKLGLGVPGNLIRSRTPRFAARQ